MKHILDVRSEKGTYPINSFGLGELLEPISPKSSFIVTDANVASALPIPKEIRTIVLPPGEPTKSFDSYRTVIDWLTQNKVKRSDKLVALGGGVIGDLAGFAAATYMRGIDLIMVPTSLLAMVDSSVGGKVAVDLPAGKNLVGSFWSPIEVRICLETLKTLPRQHLINGLAEVLKYGFIMRPGQLTLLKRWIREEQFGAVVSACINCKAEVVEDDERETTGRRAILNFGHTVGHAIESFLGYSELLHGEAISIGMVVEAKIAERLRFSGPQVTQDVTSTLREFDLPVWHPSLQHAEQLIEFMQLDKKADGFINMSLVSEIGHCELCKNISHDTIAKALFEVFANKGS